MSDVTEAIKNKLALDILVKSDGWKVVGETLNEKYDLMLCDMLNIGEDITDMKLRELRIVLINLTLLMNLPYDLIEHYQVVIDEFKQSKGE